MGKLLFLSTVTQRPSDCHRSKGQKARLISFGELAVAPFRWPDYEDIHRFLV